MHTNLVPITIHRSQDENEENNEGDNDAVGTRRKRPKKVKVVEDTGCMYHAYDWDCHQFIAHLRRVHPANPPLMMHVAGIEGQVLVKAADPFAERGIPLYYFHRKTKLCNDIFFYFWDNVMAPAFAIVCTWFTVDSQESLDNLFALEFEKDDGTKVPFLNEAATQTHISNEARNSFLKPLLEEHSQNGGRHQLKELWSAWVTKKYAVVPGPINSGAAPTPPSTPPH